MMQNGRINSPKLRPRLSSSEANIDNHVHMFRERERGVSIKPKYGHSIIMNHIIAAIY